MCVCARITWADGGGDCMTSPPEDGADDAFDPAAGSLLVACSLIVNCPKVNQHLRNTKKESKK